jgi:hypothetical protein
MHGSRNTSSKAKNVLTTTPPSGFCEIIPMVSDVVNPLNYDYRWSLYYIRLTSVKIKEDNAMIQDLIKLAY